MSGTGDVRSTSASSGYTGSSGNANIFITSTAGRYFEIEGINTSAYSDLFLSFGIKKSTNASNGTELVLEVSTNGSTYTPVSFGTLPTGSGTTAWRLVTTASGSIPAATNLRIRFRQTASSPQFRIDDITLTGFSCGEPVVTPNGNQFICMGASIELSTDAANSYQWYKDGVTIGGATSQTYEAITEGEYTVEVGDGVGCFNTSITSAIVELQTATPTVFAGLDTTICEGDTVSLNAETISTTLFISEIVEGSGNNKYIEIFNGTGADVDLSDYQIVATHNGGTAVYEIDLSGVLSHGEVAVFSHSSASIYSGEVVSTTSFIQFNGDDAVVLHNKSTNEDVDIFGVVGNDPGSAWTNDSETMSTQNHTLRRKTSVYAGIPDNPSGTGKYAFTTLELEWDEYPIDDVSGLGSHDMVAAAYSWSPSTGLSADDIQQPKAYPNSTTTYTVTATYSFGCTSSDDIEVAVNPLPQISADISNYKGYEISCYGEDDGTIDLTLTGNSPYTITWNTGSTNEDLSDLEAGTYSVRIEDTYECVQQDTFLLTQPDELSVNAGVDVKLCNGESTQLNGSFTGGVLPYNQQWFPYDGSLSDNGILNPIASPTQPTEYVLDISDGNGCALTDTVVVYINGVWYWDGEGADNHWNTALNWKGDFVPEPCDSVILDEDLVSDYSVIVENHAEIRYLEIAHGNVVLNVHESLTINEKAVNTGTVWVADTASWVQGTGSVLENTGTMTHVKEGSGNAEVFNYWSSPITHATISKNGKGGMLTGNLTYFFNDGNFDNASFKHFTASRSMSVGRGYAATGVNQATFSGTFNNGTIEYDLTVDKDPSFNLLGNPYPSSINGAAFCVENEDELEFGVLYVFKQCSELYDLDGDQEYIVVNTSGSNSVCDDMDIRLEDYNLPSCQGVFVRANPSPVTGKFRFTNAMRNVDNDYLKSGKGERGWKSSTYPSQADLAEATKIRVVISNKQNSAAATTINYLPIGTSGKDFWLDVPTSVDGTGGLSIYSKDVNNDHYFIQSTADLTGQNEVIPLTFNAPQKGAHQIEADVINLREKGYYAILADKETYRYHLLENGPYHFEAAKGMSTSRFEIMLLPVITTPVESFMNQQYGLNYSNGILNLPGIIDHIELYNTPGQRVLEQGFVANKTAVHQVEVDLPSGVYIISMSSAGHTARTQKLFIP